jgi:hypothetical protein
MTIDSNVDALSPLEDFLKTETRFAAARASNPNFDKLVEYAKENNQYKTQLKKYIAHFAMMAATKENGEG